MTLDEFKTSVTGTTPPARSSTLLQALWHDAKGDWEKAHALAQSVEDADGAWVHAYLHRKEGDSSNASYWYNRAGRSFSRTSLQAEWDDIARYLLK
jgi:hypothetical protein